MASDKRDTKPPPPNEPAQCRCWEGRLAPDALDELVRRAIASAEVTKMVANAARAAATATADELLKHRQEESQRLNELSLAVGRLNERRVWIPLVGLTTSIIALLVAMAALLLAWRTQAALLRTETQGIACEVVHVPARVFLR